MQGTEFLAQNNKMAKIEIKKGLLQQSLFYKVMSKIKALKTCNAFIKMI